MVLINCPVKTANIKRAICSIFFAVELQSNSFQQHWSYQRTIYMNDSSIFITHRLKNLTNFVMIISDINVMNAFYQKMLSDAALLTRLKAMYFVYVWVKNQSAASYSVSNTIKNTPMNLFELAINVIFPPELSYKNLYQILIY